MLAVRFKTLQPSLQAGEGTLIIDMIDASTKQLVWRGSATGVLDENPSPEKVTQNVNNAVAAILAQYPPK